MMLNQSGRLLLWAIALCVVTPFPASQGLRAQDALDLPEGDDEDEFEKELQGPKLLLYIPFDGTGEGFGPEWTDKSLMRVGLRPMQYGFVGGVVGQARGKGPFGYAGVSYPIEGAIDLEEGTLSLWFRWDKETEKGPFGSFISSDIFPLSIADEIFRGVREDETWRHIALTWKRKEAKGQVYLDGKLVHTVPMKGEWFRQPRLDENSNPLPIRHDMLIAHGLPGRVDEVYIWDTSFRQDVIRTAFGRGKAGKTSWPKESLPERQPWRPLAGLRALGEKRKSMPQSPSLNNAERRETAARLYVSLNGAWRCQPLGRTKYIPTSMVDQKALTERKKKIASWLPVPGKWLTMNVPGTWQAGAGVPTAKGWQGSSLAAYYGALCERDIDMPGDWRGKAIFLRIDGKPFLYSRSPFPISVFLNNEFIGESMASEGYPLDLTNSVAYGERNRIALLLGYPAFPAWQTQLGNVSLEVRASREITVQYAYVTPKDDPEALDVIAEITADIKKQRPLDVECVVWDWPDGQERKNLGRSRIVLEPGADPWHPVSFRFPDPHRWNPEDPHMYYLALRAYEPSGKILDEGEPVRFGFRTLAVRGKDTLLNGKPFHMRGPSHNGGGPSEGGFRFKKSVGINADRCLSKKMLPVEDAVLDACDREGWIQCYHVNFRASWRHAKQKGQREYFWARMKHLWNHPSLIFWFLWGNGYVNGPHGHPRQIGGVPGVDYDPNNEWHQHVRQAIARWHQYVPGRLIFYYRLGVGGDSRGIMHYMGWGTPIQTHEEWPSYWYENCDEPFHGSEVSLPQFKYNYLWQWGRGWNKETLAGAEGLIEHAARYFGDSAYDGVTRDIAITLDWMDHRRSLEGLGAEPVARISPDFVKAFSVKQEDPTEGGLDVDDLDELANAGPEKEDVPAALVKGADTSSPQTATAKEGEDGRWDLEFKPTFVTDTPTYWRLKSFSIRRILCAWRTYGIGYLVHCCFKTRELLAGGAGRLSAVGETVKRYNSALLLHIGGPPGDFVLKDHAFYPGERIAKQVIARNDHFRPCKVAATWRVIDTGDESEVAKGKAEFTLGVGALHKEPIVFTAPPAEQKRQLRLIISYTESGEPRQDESFDLQIFPKKQSFRPATAKVGLIDPVGDTAAMLEKVGQPFRTVDASGSLAGLDLLIIGRSGYTEGTRELLKSLDIRQAVRSGLNVIVFEQTGRWVMGLLNEHFDNRYAFIRDRQSGLFDGLDDADFAHWRGQTEIVDAYPDWDRTRDWRRGKFSKHGMGNEFGQGRFYHWSNKGMVCAFSYNKPQVGNFRVLMDNAFDLLYTPLLEERMGDGRILFCQLEVTDRYARDPAASLLVDRLLGEYSIKRPAPKATVAYLGGPDGLKLIEPLGLKFQTIDDLDTMPAGEGILIVSAGEALDKLTHAKATIDRFVTRGGKLVILPVAAETDMSWAPVGLGREKGEAFITRNVAECPLLRGLGVSDLFWRRAVRCVRVSSEAEGAYNADSGLICTVPFGKGLVVVCQIDPSWFEWCWQQGKATRVWSALFRNLGVRSAQEIDPLCADKTAFSQIYHVRALPFDPDAHAVW